MAPRLLACPSRHGKLRLSAEFAWLRRRRYHAVASVMEDVLSIIIASDVHLGYGEKDPIRGDDSFNSFEEVLAIALERNVDMVLLAGDLFHDNKPSRKCLMRCMQLLRDYCLGEREVQIEVVSDPATNFHSKCARIRGCGRRISPQHSPESPHWPRFALGVTSQPAARGHGRRNLTVNYEDPNYNVQLPVFSIHGNHDDPAGDGGLAALDILSTANLVRRALAATPAHSRASLASSP